MHFNNPFLFPPLSSLINLAQEQDKQFLYEEIMKANVICIVYSVEDELTIEKV